MAKGIVGDDGFVYWYLSPYSFINVTFEEVTDELTNEEVVELLIVAILDWENVARTGGF